VISASQRQEPFGEFKYFHNFKGLVSKLAFNSTTVDVITTVIMPPHTRGASSNEFNVEQHLLPSLS
jgi:hypothetical protein